MKKQRIKNKKARKIVTISVLSVVILCLIVFFIWYLTPKKMPRVDAASVAKIYLFDGNSGLETNFTEKEDIGYIISTLQSTEYKAKELDHYIGTTFQLYFYNGTGEIIDKITFMDEDLVIKGMWIYTPKNSLKEIYNYFYDTLGSQW